MRKRGMPYIGFSISLYHKTNKTNHGQLQFTKYVYTRFSQRIRSKTNLSLLDLNLPKKQKSREEYKTNQNQKKRKGINSST